MFTFDQTPVKFVGLLVLLTWCTIWCARELARSRGARQRICDALHLLMAVVMLAMVPKPVWVALTGAIPVPVVVAAFAAATLWFVWLTAGAPGRSARSDDAADHACADLAHAGHADLAHAGHAGRAHAGHAGRAHAGHAAMFAAMTWHLTAMAVKASARAELGMGPAMREWMEQAGRPGRVLWVFALVGLPFMAYLLVAGVLALRRALRPGAAAGRRLAAMSDFAMNFGMFWMSTGLLTPILPFFAALAF